MHHFPLNHVYRCESVGAYAYSGSSTDASAQCGVALKRNLGRCKACSDEPVFPTGIYQSLLMGNERLKPTIGQRFEVYLQLMHALQIFIVQHTQEKSPTGIPWRSKSSACVDGVVFNRETRWQALPALSPERI